MEQYTPYRYKTDSPGSYNELAHYAINTMATVTLFPESQTIVITPTKQHGQIIKEVGCYIDREGLDFHITPVEIDDESIERAAISETADPHSLRNVILKLLGERKISEEKHESVLSEIANERTDLKRMLGEVSRERSVLRDRWLKATGENRRIKEQVGAIATLVSAICPKD